MTDVQTKEKLVPEVFNVEKVRFEGNEAFIEICYQMLLQDLILRFKLVFKNVGSEEKPIWIAIFHPGESEEARTMGTDVLIRMMKGFNKENALAITPESSKSKRMILDACTAAGVECLELKGDKDRRKVETQLNAEGGGKMVDSYPITNGDQPKFMGFTNAQIQSIKDAIEHDKTILLLDDVVSSGGTMRAIIEFIETEYGTATLQDMRDRGKLQIKAVAREGVLDNENHFAPIDLDSILEYAIGLPKVLSDLQEAINERMNYLKAA